MFRSAGQDLCCEGGARGALLGPVEFSNAAALHLLGNLPQELILLTGHPLWKDQALQRFLQMHPIIEYQRRRSKGHSQSFLHPIIEDQGLRLEDHSQSYMTLSALTGYPSSLQLGVAKQCRDLKVTHFI